MEKDFTELANKREKMCRKLLSKVQALGTISADVADWSLDIVGSDRYE